MCSGNSNRQITEKMSAIIVIKKLVNLIKKNELKYLCSVR